MKMNTKRIAAGAIFAALIVISLALSVLFPTLDFTLAAIAAFVLYILILEFGKLSGLLCYFVAGILSLVLLPVKNCALFFVFFFGWYPFLRVFTSKCSLIWAWIIKLCAAAFSGIVFFLIFSVILPLDSLNGYFTVVTLILYLAVFVVYELGLSKLLLIYQNKIRMKLFGKI